MLPHRQSHSQTANRNVIRDDKHAVAVATALSEQYALEASQRDEQRIPPDVEMSLFAKSGLLGCTLPAEYGGADIAVSTLVDIVRLISIADPSIGQIPVTHFGAINTLKTLGAEPQKRRYFERVMAGERFGSATSERDTRHARDIKTTLQAKGDSYLLNGTKYYCTGAQFSDWLQVLALDEEGHLARVFVQTHSEGVTLHNDWTGFGQRITGSGSVSFDQVVLEASQILPAHTLYDDQLSLQGAFVQILHAAIDAGIAEAALKDTQSFIKSRSRPWIDSGKETAGEDPYIVSAIGLLSVRYKAARALLSRAAEKLDALTTQRVTSKMAADISVAVAEARILTTQIALDASQKLFELAGTSSALGHLGFDRHWRNARTHTLHDPIRWKYKIVGNYWLNNEYPQRHSFI
ncbi:SfnB family sulfur acquisition oxidoreductase [Pantoea sp. DY-5]|uniref:SfnB family sulfur acquisition oxidoreductase n=1 Tax=Pantoea sp. DY-5 TaxID=2871488 RepID=UPI001C96A3B7|nr:SfnB family sulfur acquisition oxidoreductase [Pantoea sp. DY-5]MBY4841202.1 SfnB family sulfur acquisition oxidoreductase [Pantoea sp. DY-5]